MIKIVALVFLLLVRCRFQAKKSIIDILRKRYGENLVKNVRKFEKLDFKHKKATLDLDFLHSCKKQNVIPKFLKLKVANRQLLTSNEISNKHKVVRPLNLKLVCLKDSIKYVMNFIDFVHITTVFLASNNWNISKIRNVHCKKLAIYLLIIVILNQ